MRNFADEYIYESQTLFMRFRMRFIVFIFSVCAFSAQGQKNRNVLMPLRILQPIPIKQENRFENYADIVYKVMNIVSGIGSEQVLLNVKNEFNTVEIVAPRIYAHDCKDGTTKPCYFVYTQKEQVYAQNTLASVLENETALTLKSYGIGSVTLSARGTASSQNTVTWNGINLQNALSGVVDLSTISMNTVQKATVSYGGSSAANGSGAIGSVIALENNLPETNGLNGKVNLGIGSYGDRRESGQLNYVSPAFAAGVSAMYKSADNNFLFRNTSQIGQPLQNLSNAQENTWQVLQQTRTTISPQQTLNTYLWYTHADRQLPPTMLESNTHQFQRDENLRALADWSDKIKNNTLNIRAAYTDEFLTYYSDVVSDSKNRSTTSLVEITDKIRISDFGFRKPIDSEKSNITPNINSETRNPTSEMRIGLNASNTVVRSNNFPDGIKRSRASAFTAYTWQPERFNFTAQLREELTDGKFTPLIYSLDLKYKIIKTGKVGLRLLGAYSHNYNVPPLNELYFAHYGNPNLLPEESTNYESGLEFEKSTNNFNFIVRSTAYYIYMRNRIQAVPQADGQFHPINIPEVNSKGIESFASVQYFRSRFSASVELSHTYTHAVDNDNFLLIYIPQHVANAALYLRRNGWFFRYTQIYSGQRYVTTDNTYFTKAYSIANAVLGTEKKLKRYTVNAQIHIKNVFDSDYQVISFYPMPKRTFLLQLGFGF